jgi:CHAD domain-containing protein
MNQPREVTYILRGALETEDFLKKLDQHFLVEAQQTRTGQRTYYDTFDWRLFRRNLICSQASGQLRLVNISGSSVAEESVRKRAKYFCWDFAENTFARQLAKIIEMRALCPLVSLVATAHHYRVLNKDRKTIARLALHSETLDTDTELASTPLPELFTIQEIRGYESPYEKVLEFCRLQNLEPVNRKQYLERVLAASGRDVLDYGEKFRVALDPEDDIGGAIAKISLHLLGDMQKNYDGLYADIDTEFLHDFRIAVRRTRSLLSLTRKVLPAEEASYFQQEFSWLGGFTGALRDIDVYLLEKQNYLDMLPDSLQPGMEIFFDELHQNRIQELKLLRQHLKSERYANLLRDWQAFLSDPESELFSGPRTGRCREFADAVISKRYDRFLKDGKKITSSTPDEALHRLRIKGKKLRYLLEFFKSYYDDAQLERIVKHMKRLQDNLGDFNDLSVQQQMLGARLDALRSRNLQTIRLGAALGGLIALLNSRHQQVRSRFEATFEQFSETRVSALLKTMLDGRKK